MGNHVELTKAGQQYAEAYAAHYTTKDLLEALELYRGVMDAHPDSKEAAYSRSQLLNIVHGVIPAREIFDAQVDMAQGRLGRVSSAGAEPAPIGPSEQDTDGGKDTIDDTSR